MRGLETDRLVLTTEYREGKVRVVVEARDENNRPLTDLKLEGKVSSPGGLQEGRAADRFEVRATGRRLLRSRVQGRGSRFVHRQRAGRCGNRRAIRGRFRRSLPTTVEERDGQLATRRRHARAS